MGKQVVWKNCVFIHLDTGTILYNSNFQKFDSHEFLLAVKRVKRERGHGVEIEVGVEKERKKFPLSISAFIMAI